MNKTNGNSQILVICEYRGKKTPFCAKYAIQVVKIRKCRDGKLSESGSLDIWSGGGEAQ